MSTGHGSSFREKQKSMRLRGIIEIFFVRVRQTKRWPCLFADVYFAEVTLFFIRRWMWKWSADWIWKKRTERIRNWTNICFSCFFVMRKLQRVSVSLSTCLIRNAPDDEKRRIFSSLAAHQYSNVVSMIVYRFLSFWQRYTIIELKMNIWFVDKWTLSNDSLDYNWIKTVNTWIYLNEIFFFNNVCL